MTETLRVTGRLEHDCTICGFEMVSDESNVRAYVAERDLAHLFAASPDLYAACLPTLSENAWERIAETAETMTAMDDPEGDALTFLVEREARIRAALRKARGESSNV